MPYLRIKEQNQVNKTTLTGETVIGRMPECTVQLQEPYASRRHAAIFNRNGAWFIRDMETRNGTLVNGEKISETRLASGDTIAIGKAVITFVDEEAPQPVANSSEIGDYRVVAEITRTAYARVCEVKKEGIDRRMVLKAFKPEAFLHGVGNLFTAVRSLAGVNHPAVAAIYEVNPRGDEPYYVTEKVEGENLAELVAARGKLPPAQAKQIVTSIAEGLQAAHARDVVHGNLKPRNVLVTRSGNVKLVDFGGACQIQATGSWPDDLAAFAGVPHYLAPEQILKRPADRRTDVYALGAIFYCMITGMPPFTGSSDEQVMCKHLADKPQPPEEIVPDIQPEICLMIHRMLAKDPSARYQTMQEVLAELQSQQPQQQQPQQQQPHETLEHEAARPGRRTASARRQSHPVLEFFGGILFILMLVAMFLGARDLGQFTRQAMHNWFGGKTASASDESQTETGTASDNSGE